MFGALPPSVPLCRILTSAMAYGWGVSGLSGRFIKSAISGSGTLFSGFTAIRTVPYTIVVVVVAVRTKGRVGNGSRNGHQYYRHHHRQRQERHQGECDQCDAQHGRRYASSPRPRAVVMVSRPSDCQPTTSAHLTGENKTRGK